MPPDFSQMTANRPDMDAVTSTYNQLRAKYEGASNTNARVQVIKRWDKLCQDLSTWTSLTRLKFNQDTADDVRKAEREYCDEISPQLLELSVAFKRMLLADTNRGDVAEQLGEHAYRLWEADITTFEPAISEDLVKLNKLGAEFVELRASAQIPFQGKTYNLSELRQFFQAPDRAIRKSAQEARWGWYSDNSEQLDRIFDEMVRLRQKMAVTIGYENYIPLGYQCMQRVDYSHKDVEFFRDQVVKHVVPLATELRRRQADKLGIERLMAWDEPVHDLAGNPRPCGDHDWMLSRATEMFDAMSPELGEFFRMMHNRNLLDLKTREGKAGGGFCTSFPNYDVPFIFANFNGTKADVVVFTHEVGHAFQNWMARDVELSSYTWPTYEAAEIHSMSLEFLTWPHMEKFFGEDASRFRQIHLLESLLFFPYGVAVDHFQHLVYANPEATPAQRNQMWLEMEARYLPWRQWGDLEHPSGGGRWQAQSHIYGMPFYYIDYTLALSCALQFWDRSEQDYEKALKDYTRLCARGGEAPFQTLAKDSGLISPFEPGCLERVVQRARQELGL